VHVIQPPRLLATKILKGQRQKTIRQSLPNIDNALRGLYVLAIGHQATLLINLKGRRHEE
jgi:hypothetical protein